MNRNIKYGLGCMQEQRSVLLTNMTIRYALLHGYCTVPLIQTNKRFFTTQNALQTTFIFDCKKILV